MSCSHGTDIASDGHRLRHVASYRGITATLTARSGRDDQGWRDLGLRLSTRDRQIADLHLVVPDAVAPVVQPRNIDLEPLDQRNGAICLAQMGRGQLVAAVGVSFGNNCCGGAVTVPVEPDGVGSPRWFSFDDHGAELATVGEQARFISGDWMGCTEFWPCAGGGSALVIQGFDGVSRVDVTRDFPRLLQEDAQFWRHAITTHPPGETFGWIPAWVADECRLHREHAAWHWLHKQLAAGRLRGDRYNPGGRRLVTFLHRSLNSQGFCT